MDVDNLIQALDNLTPNERARVQAHLADSNAPEGHTDEEWQARLDAVLDEFWADTPPEERAAILEAINTKSAPAEQA